MLSTRGLIGLILCSAIVTFDGTAVTVALPDIARSLQAPFSSLQWITNASLIMVAAFVVPAGALGDLHGRRRVMRLGLILFAGASLGCAAAPSATWLILLRVVQGAAAALIVPGAVALLRGSYRDEVDRTRAFGLWAGWSGLATVVGPVAGGALADMWSWRAVFVTSAALALPAFWLLAAVPESSTERRERVSVTSTIFVVVVLGSLSYALIEGGERWTSPTVLAALAVAAGTGVLLSRHKRLHSLIPPELGRSRNCVAANGVTAAMYFGLFGLSFLLVIYTQGVLGYSATWAGMTVLPMALPMLLSERFGRLTARVGSRLMVTAGVVTAGLGVVWLTVGPDPLPFWSFIIPGMAVFGTGLSIAISPLTNAAVSSVPADCAGAASGVHHAIVRAAGLVAIAALGTIAAAGGEAGSLSRDGFRTALLVCAVIVLLPGVVLARRIRDDDAGGLAEAA